MASRRFLTWRLSTCVIKPVTSLSTLLTGGRPSVPFITPPHLNAALTLCFPGPLIRASGASPTFCFPGSLPLFFTGSASEALRRCQ